MKDHTPKRSHFAPFLLDFCSLLMLPRAPLAPYEIQNGLYAQSCFRPTFQFPLFDLIIVIFQDTSDNGVSADTSGNSSSFLDPSSISPYRETGSSSMTTYPSSHYSSLAAADRQCLTSISKTIDK